MRLLILTGSYPPDRCGVGDYCHALRGALEELGHQVYVITVIAKSVDGSDSDEGVMRSISGGSIFGARKLSREIQLINPDLVHVQHPTAGYGKGLLPYILPLLCWLLGKPLVQTWHEPFPVRFTPLALLMALAPGPIIVVRNNYRELSNAVLRAVLKCKKVVYVGSGSSIPKASLSAAERSSIRSRFPKDKKLVLFFGFISRDKGIARVFEFACPDRDFFIIAGASNDGGQHKAELTNTAEVSGWRDSFAFTGDLPSAEIAALLSVADVCVFPFEDGGGDWNSSLQAAWYNSAFCITTSIREHGYNPNKHTYFAKIGDTDEMKSALNDYFDKRYQPGTEFSPPSPWPRIAADHLSLYSHLLDRG